MNPNTSPSLSPSPSPITITITHPQPEPEPELEHFTPHEWLEISMHIMSDDNQSVRSFISSHQPVSKGQLATLLYMACYDDARLIVQTLLDLGADPNYLEPINSNMARISGFVVPHKYTTSPFQRSLCLPCFSSRHASDDVVLSLIKHNANPFTPISESHAIPLHIALTRRSDQVCAAMLLSPHAAVHLASPHADTPRSPVWTPYANNFILLHAAVDRNLKSTAKVLLHSLSASVNVRDPVTGDTALSIAACSRLPTMCSILLDAGANPFVHSTRFIIASRAARSQKPSSRYRDLNNLMRSHIRARLLIHLIRKCPLFPTEVTDGIIPHLFPPSSTVPKDCQRAMNDALWELELVGSS